jgi:hypothetical protein
MDLEPVPTFCRGCGEPLILEVPFGGTPASIIEPTGRASYYVNGWVVHQCADGTYSSP